MRVWEVYPAGQVLLRGIFVARLLPQVTVEIVREQMQGILFESGKIDILRKSEGKL